MDLVPKGKVCVFTQAVLSQVPIIQLWAAYRIKKLGWYLVLVFIPYSIAWYFAEQTDPNFSMLSVITKFFEEGVWASLSIFPLWFALLDILFVILGVSVMIVWSRAWNREVDEMS